MRSPTRLKDKLKFLKRVSFTHYRQYEITYIFQ